MFYDLGDEFLILFFGILFVKDAIGFIFESDTGETVGTTVQHHGIENIVRCPDIINTEEITTS